MATYFHFPTMPRNSTYILGMDWPDQLIVLEGSILQNSSEIIEIWSFPSTVTIQPDVFLEGTTNSVISGFAPATTISIGARSTLTLRPFDTSLFLAPVIDLFKSPSVGTYGQGMAAEITNSGRLIANGRAAIGISSGDGGNTIYNYGTIDVTESSGSADAFGIIIYSDRNVTNVNTSNLIVNGEFGVIEARAIVTEAWAIRTSHDDDTVQNQGRITGLVDLGGGDDVFENSGTVENLFGAPPQVVLGAGDDRFTQIGTGTPKVTVSGGTGNDLFEIDDPTGWSIVENAGEGTDTMSVAVDWSLQGTEFENLILRGTTDLRGIANKLDNTITGNAGANFITAGKGNDSVIGGAGDDLIRGRFGNDWLDGGADADILSGWDGNDVLLGGAGNDRLFGDAGQDTLTGGAGRDLLSGGADADVFVYLAAADSPVGAGRDAILDFEIGVDVIDLSGVSDDTISWVAAGAFTGTGPEIFVIEVGGNSIASVDVDGDGALDMQIALAGVTGLTADDFVL